MPYGIESQPSQKMFFAAASHMAGSALSVWNNNPHSLGYERTRVEMSVAGASTHASVTRTFQCWAEHRFLYRYIAEQCLASNIKHKKMEMFSPTYMVEQCLEK